MDDFCIFCLTLKNSPRHIKRDKDYGELNLNYQFVEGIYLNDIDEVPESFYKTYPDKFKLSTFKDNDTFIPRTYACALGQKKLIETFLESNYNYAIICEDDCYFNNDLAKYINIIKQLVDEAANGIIDVATIFFHTAIEDNKILKTPLSPHIYNDVSSNITRSTMCKIINKNGGKILNDIYEELYMPCDVQFQMANIKCAIGQDFGMQQDIEDKYNSVIGYGL